MNQTPNVKPIRTKEYDIPKQNTVLLVHYLQEASY